jgi:hypothetical protein
MMKFTEVVVAQSWVEGRGKGRSNLGRGFLEVGVEMVGENLCNQSDTLLQLQIGQTPHHRRLELPPVESVEADIEQTRQVSDPLGVEEMVFETEALGAHRQGTNSSERWVTESADNRLGIFSDDTAWRQLCPSPSVLRDLQFDDEGFACDGCSPKSLDDTFPIALFGVVFQRSLTGSEQDSVAAHDPHRSFIGVGHHFSLP